MTHDQPDELTINLHVHLHDAQGNTVVLQKLDQILAGFGSLKTEVTHMAGELDALTTQVAANTDAEASAVILLGQLHDLIVAAGTDPAKLSALTSSLSSSKDALAAAIVANTPVA